MQAHEITLSPYLAFNGNCREAINFYNEVLGGELNIQTYGDAPMEVPSDQRDRVMHATLALGQTTIMASDGRPDKEVVFGDSVSLLITALKVEEGERIFNSLSAGGTITMPWEKTFWGAMFGRCKDKFGIDWMVNVELEEQAV